MPIFFNGNRVGCAVAIPDDYSVGAVSLLTLQPTLSWQTHRTIVTQLGITQQGNFKLSHMLGNDIYLYVFGDRLSTVRLHGCALSSDGCSRGGDAHGLSYLLWWYHQNKISRRSSPIQLAIGRGEATFSGYVGGMDAQVTDPSLQIVQYTLDIFCPPDKEVGSAGQGLSGFGEGSSRSGAGNSGRRSGAGQLVSPLPSTPRIPVTYSLDGDSPPFFIE